MIRVKLSYKMSHQTILALLDAELDRLRKVRILLSEPSESAKPLRPSIKAPRKARLIEPAVLSVPSLPVSAPLPENTKPATEPRV